MASESGLFESVIYNDKLDVEDGVDLLVLKNNKCFAVNLYTKTRRAIESRFKKAYRHKKLDDSITNVEFPVEFKGSVKCGNFFLYGIDDIKMFAAIATEEINKSRVIPCFFKIQNRKYYSVADWLFDCFLSVYSLWHPKYFLHMFLLLLDFCIL